MTMVMTLRHQLGLIGQGKYLISFVHFLTQHVGTDLQCKGIIKGYHQLTSSYLL